MKAKVKRGTAAGNLYCGLSTLCDVTCHLKLCETIATDCVCTRFGWKEAMIQQAYNFVCQQIHRSNLLPKQSLSKLIINSLAIVRDSNFFPHPPPYLVLLVYASLGGFQMAAQRACSEDGLSLNLWWHPCEASFEVWLKFVRVSGPLYLIHDKNRVQLK